MFTHLTSDDPDDLEVTFKILGVNNWPHPPSFISIHQVVYPIYPIWPHSLVDLWWCWSTDHYKLGLSVIEMHPPSRDAPIHQVSGPCDPQSPRSPFDLRWPLMTLKTFGTNNWHHTLSSMSIHQCLPHLTSIDLGWTLMTLNWPSKMFASTIDPTHEGSCQSTNIDLIWPWSDLQNVHH